MSRFNYGGQAVIEGVMMRGKKYWAVAVRKANNDIMVKQGPVESITTKYPILGKPFIRGFVSLIESLVLGMKTLFFSADEYAEEEVGELTTKDYIITFGLAFLLTVGLFIIFPAYLIRLIQGAIHNNIVLNLVEGLIKISMFILYYIAAISLMKDIRRIFQYHGAEHKTIKCYEAGEELTVENARKYSTMHPRCGTNFVFITLIISVLVFSLLFGRPPFLLRVLLHLCILPIVAGLSYEVIRQAGKEHPLFIFRILAAPGMALQLLTTREPDDSQLEVAIIALKTVLDKDNHFDSNHKIIEFPTTSNARIE